MSVMNEENDQPKPISDPQDIQTLGSKTDRTRKEFLFGVLLSIILIIIVDIFLTIVLVLLERRFNGHAYIMLLLPVVFIIILSFKVAVIMFFGKIIIFFTRR